jgi:HSP20 family protein
MPGDGRSLSHDPVFDRLERQMDDLVQRLLRRPSPAAYQRAWAPRLDVYDTGDAFVIVVELSGVEPGDVTIEIEGAEVAITGSRSPARPPPVSSRGAPAGAECLQIEIPFGEFERRLILPLPVDARSATAEFADGTLTVTLPKVNTGPTRVEVESDRAKRPPSEI